MLEQKDIISDLRASFGFVERPHNQSGPQDPERTAEMLRLHVEEGKTLQEIGDIFGVTRERVRQLIRVGDAGRKSKTVREQKLRQKILGRPDLTNNKLAELLGVSGGLISTRRGKTRHAISSGNVQRGTLAEEAVSAKLNELGIPHKLMPHHHPFDILLENGKRVDVKSRQSQTIPPSSHLKTTQWHFNTGREANRGNYTDFLILFVVGCFFVVPFSATTESQIAFCWPPTKRASKWHQYLNRFDLLQS